MAKKEKTVIIIGAGPAGLTAAYELLQRTDFKPIIYEATGEIGGISRTVNYKGNRIDIGGHRFFSKSQRVLDWWFNILPLQGRPARDDIVYGRDVSVSTDPNAPDPEKTDKVLLVRQRVSRIFFLKRFFDYPLSPGLNTLSGLGLRRISKITLSYLKSRAFPIRPEESLEDFFVNRFGRELYATFFRDYTEKVWGVPCHQISPEWGQQRIKGLSIKRAVVDAARAFWARDRSLPQKEIETSLIRQFLYPKLGPGQLWEEVARLIRAKGGELHLNHTVVGLNTDKQRVTEVSVRNELEGEVHQVRGDYFFSSMPVKDLAGAIAPSAPDDVLEVAQGLVYRDFITVGLLLARLRTPSGNRTLSPNGSIPDCWLYIQESYVKVGRIQIFNSWSPYLVADPSTIWVGLEYFCREGDKLWRMSDLELSRLAAAEMGELGFVDPGDVLDSTVIRTLKAYPAYFGTYDRFRVVREYTDRFENLFLIGRNGMHRYNNTDHSMLSAMAAVDAIAEGVKSKDVVWAVNPEAAYHEERG